MAAGDAGALILGFSTEQAGLGDLSKRRLSDLRRAFSGAPFAFRAVERDNPAHFHGEDF